VDAQLLQHVVHAAVYVLACDPKEVLTLPRRYRLTRREGFSRILKQRAQTKLWFAVHIEANSTGHARLGMSVSKRILPTSNQRNGVKRLIRECFRIRSRQGCAQDVVIRLRKPLDRKDFPSARATLDEMLKTVLAVK
jgi:ribonuclease P protein component